MGSSNSTATATLAIDASQMTSGEREAVAALNRVVNASKSARSELERPVKQSGPASGGGGGLALEGERRVRRNLAGIAKDLRGVQDAGTAAAIVVDRLSETFKVGLAAGIGASVGIAIKDALDKSEEEFNEFQKNVADSLEFNPTKASKDEFKGSEEKHKAIADKYAEDQENPLHRPLNAVNSEIKAIATQDPTLENAQNKIEDQENEDALKRLESEKKVTNEIEAQATLLGKADADHAQAQAKISAQRTDGSGFQISDTEAKLEQFQADIDLLQKKADAASSILSKSPQSEPLQNDNEEAQAALLEKQSEMKKFSHDEIQDQQKKTTEIEAQNLELEAQISGNKSLADSIQRQVKYEEELNAALKAHNYELAGQIKQNYQLQNVMAANAAVTNPNGSIKTTQQRNQEGQKERAQARKVSRAERNYEDDLGLTNVERDGSGQVIRGKDPTTGEYKNVTAQDRADFKAKYPDRSTPSLLDRVKPGGEMDDYIKNKSGFHSSDLAEMVGSKAQNSKTTDAGKTSEKIEKSLSDIASVILGWK